MSRRRGLQLGAGGLVVLLATLLALLTLLATGRATGADAAHCARLALQSQVRERMATGHGSPLVVIGDSYSVGLGLRRPQASWPSELPGRVHVFGFSGSGFSADASACKGVSYGARALHARHTGGPVVVEGGLNDYDQPAADVRAGFRTLMHELAGRHVLVVGPPAAPARAAGARRVDAILAEESARAGVSYLSMNGHTFDYLDDGLHLTPAGHRAFGEVVSRALSR